MSFERFNIIRDAYIKLDTANKSSPPNSVSLDDIARLYSVNHSPDVTNGKLTADQAYK